MAVLYDPNNLKVIYDATAKKVQEASPFGSDCCCFLDPDLEWDKDKNYQMGDLAYNVVGTGGSYTGTYKCLYNNCLNHPTSPLDWLPNHAYSIGDFALGYTIPQYGSGVLSTYRCIAAFTSGADVNTDSRHPATGANWATYWVIEEIWWEKVSTIRACGNTEWDAYPPFGGLGKSPKYVKVTFSGISTTNFCFNEDEEIDCDTNKNKFNPNQSFILTKDAGNGCRWSCCGDGWPHWCIAFAIGGGAVMSLYNFPEYTEGWVDHVNYYIYESIHVYNAVGHYYDFYMSRKDDNENHTPPTAPASDEWWWYMIRADNVNQYYCEYFNTLPVADPYEGNEDCGYAQEDWVNNQWYTGGGAYYGSLVKYNGYNYYAQQDNYNQAPSGGDSDNTQWLVSHDIDFAVNNRISHGGMYRCIQACHPHPMNEPGVGSAWESYWVIDGCFGAVTTPIKNYCSSHNDSTCRDSMPFNGQAQAAFITTRPTISLGIAYAPQPEDEEEDVILSHTLNWQAGANAGSQNIYLDTVNPPVTLIATVLGDVETYNAGTLLCDTQYYWRIDSVIANCAVGAGTAEGDVWMFQTKACQTDFTPPTPNPMTWTTYPHIDGANHHMACTSASDSDGSTPIEYYFEGFGGGTSSGWITSNEYTVAGGAYAAYRVCARDSLGNTGGWSPKYGTDGYPLP